MRVHLCRHAEAAPGAPDELRQLTSAGALAAAALGTRLATEEPRPAVVLTSPLVRARQTAEILAEALEVRVLVDTRLAPGASAADLRAAVHGLEEPVVAVGHQPDCSEIAEVLTGERVGFAPGGVLALDVAPLDEAP
jgi:phosphohistidine phosphatase